MEEKSKNWVAFLVVAAVIVVGYFAFSSPSSTGEGDIKIGFIAPLSGDAAVYGEPALQVTQMAFDEINEAGGVDGRMLKLVAEDGQCDGLEAANAMQKLVNVDGVSLVTGFVCSSEALSSVSIGNDSEVPMISMTATSPDLTTEGGEYFFRTIPSDAIQGEVLADVAYNWNGWEKVAAIQENTDYAVGFVNAFTDTFVEYGGEMVTEAFDSETEDFRTALAKLKESSPNALLISVQTPAAGERIIKQVGELGWEIDYIAIDVMSSAELLTTDPEAVEGMILAQFGYDAESDEIKKLLADYKEAYGLDLEFLNYMQAVYDTAYIISEAVAAAGEDGPKLKDWLMAMEPWTGLSGTFNFDENGDRQGGGHTPEVVRDGVVIDLTAPELSE